MILRKVHRNEYERVWELFKQIIDQKVYFAYDRTTTRAQIEASWINDKNLIYGAETEGEIVGAYIIKPNHPGHGAHVANAAYMVDSRFRGHGIGRKLAAHSIEMARNAGYRAMQYNMVVSTNENAVHLWKAHGFEIIGTIPEGFLHHEHGYVDAYIMYRKL